MFSDASENKTTESLTAVSRHYDQITAQSFRRLNNFDTRIAQHNCDFAGNLAVNFPPCQSLKLGSRGGLDSNEG